MALALVWNDQEERDRLECVRLAAQQSISNRDLAQWLIDHMQYSQRTVARWLKCDHTSIHYLRKWAREGFNGSPFDNANKRDKREWHGSGAGTSTPMVDDDFEADDNVEDPTVILRNVLQSIDQSKGVAEAYRKIFTVSPFDQEAKKQINDAIDLLILKWRRVQSTLTSKRKSHHGQACNG